jgi:hypothetical protein
MTGEADRPTVCINVVYPAAGLRCAESRTLRKSESRDGTSSAAREGSAARRGALDAQTVDATEILAVWPR